MIEKLLLTAQQKKVLMLASILLEKYSVVLAGNGCNDPEPEITQMVKDIGISAFKEMANTWNGGEIADAQHFDWIIAGTISRELEFLAKHG